MQRQILVTIPVEERHRTYFSEIVGDSDVRFIYRDRTCVTDKDIRSADALIGNLPPDMLRGCTNLKWVQLNSAGAAEYTEEGVLPNHCVLTNAAGAYGLAVSEHMLALTFALIRRFGQYGRNQVQHEWKQMGRITSVEGSTVVVLGLGDIGGSYARKMKALGAYVIGVRRTDREKPACLDEQLTMEHLDEVLPRADIVAMVLPGVLETEHVMDARRLSFLKQGAYLINVGRGNAIEPEALKEALRSGRLGGAGLDVTEPEPLPADDALWDFDNVILTPHAAGQFFLQETFERIVRIAGENLAAYLGDGNFKHVVSRECGY